MRLTVISEDRNAGGGYDPTPAQIKQFKNADLITLPKGVEGTNCSNCRFLGRKMEKGKVETICLHDSLKGTEVSARMCCAFWDNNGVVRHWDA